MTFRVCSALLWLLWGCATAGPSPEEARQVAPVSPLVLPRPIVVPAPVGLAPPAPLVVLPEGEPTPRPKSSTDKEPAPTLTAEQRPECIPQRVPHLGGDALHDTCADRVPQNAFPGAHVLVNGKRFDALQAHVRTLWEIKTDNFDTYTDDLRDIVLRKQIPELLRERALARACGFDFRVGVRSAAHQAALLDRDPTLRIVVMDWC